MPGTAVGETTTFVLGREVDGNRETATFVAGQSYDLDFEDVQAYGADDTDFPYTA